MAPTDRSRPSLPPLTRRIVAWLAPRHWRESILGDLAEEQHRWRADGTPGRSARLAVSALVACARLQWEHRSGRARVGPRQHAGRLTATVAEARGALRSLRTRPGTSLLALLTLTLGIGVTTSVFSLAHWLMFRPIPGVASPESLVTVRLQSKDGSTFPTSGHDVTDLSSASALVGLAGFEKTVLHVARPDGLGAMRVNGEYVNVNYFDILEQRLTTGRRFTAADAAAGPATNIVIVSDDFARATFGQAEAAQGHALLIDEGPFQIIGVAAMGFHGPSRTDDTDIWMPVTLKQSARVDDSRTALFLTLLGRLKSGATVEEAASQLEAIRRTQGRGSAHSHYSVETGLAAPTWQRKGLLETFDLVWGVSALLLLLTCANVGNLLLARASERTGEFATRQALGASRGRLMVGVLFEALWLAAAGGALAVLAARLVTDLLERTVIIRNMPPLGHVEIAWPVLGIAVAASSLVAVATGLVPALVGSRVDLLCSLKTIGRGHSPGRRRLRTALVVAQVAVTLTLSIGGFLLLRSMLARARVPLGFHPEAVLAFSLDPGIGVNGGTADHEIAYFTRLLDDVRHAPGVAAAGLAWVEPFKPIGGGGALRAADRPNAAEVTTDTNMISPGFFDALGIPVLAGRDFTPHELFRSDQGGGGVVILNAALARALFGGTAAVGQRVLMSYPEGRVREVVGVVGDTRTRTLGGPPALTYYEPFGQSYLMGWGTVHVRVTQPASAVVPTIRAIVHSLDPMLPAYDIETLTDSLGRYLAEDAMLMRVTVAFALVALVLAAVGLYGVLARQIEERRQEFGVRLALGARPRAVGRLVTAEAARALAVGTALGLVASAWLVRLIASRLFGVTKADPVALLGAVGLVMTVTFVAALPVARRASRLDPADVLRR
jgi:putative ABC transport system permease protein